MLNNSRFRPVCVLFVFALLSSVAVLGDTFAAGVSARTSEDGRIYVPIAVGRPFPPDVPGGPDQIVYEVGGSRSVITTIRADGSGKMGLTLPSADNYSPAWSPDRRFIAYVHQLPSSAYQLMVMKANGSEARALPTPDLDFVVNPTWSPDGNTLIFNGLEGGEGWDIYRIGLDGSGLTNLTLDLDRNTSSPDWAPNGSRVAFTYASSSGAFELWTMNPDGSDKQNIGTDDGNYFNPAWSPDSQTILFDRRPAGSSVDGIFMVAIGGGPVQPVVDSGTDAAWSPSGEGIVFTSPSGGIFRFDIGSQSVTPVDPDPDARAADW